MRGLSIKTLAVFALSLFLVSLARPQEQQKSSHQELAGVALAIFAAAPVPGG
jgi:preprotein translocase subunit YajC